jgi:mRNA-degrading endonuclease toxin of MazEF toxin-antitoxin module
MNKSSRRPYQGEIWLAKFKKTKETPKTFRPCLVISNDIQNELDELIVVVPITTNNIENIEPFEVFIENTPETGLDHPSKVQFIYPITIDKELRLSGQQRLGVISREIMAKAKLLWKIAFDIES